MKKRKKRVRLVRAAVAAIDPCVVSKRANDGISMQKRRFIKKIELDDVKKGWRILTKTPPDDMISSSKRSHRIKLLDFVKGR
ncbi:MAG: hypothetical protein GX417_12140 [Clostridiales bacterium]|nr:hypothetical protein [Clostridiales bacterium]